LSFEPIPLFDFGESLTQQTPKVQKKITQNAGLTTFCVKNSTKNEAWEGKRAKNYTPLSSGVMTSFNSYFILEH
jgi:hypothetical protein